MTIFVPETRRGGIASEVRVRLITGAKDALRWALGGSFSETEQHSAYDWLETLLTPVVEECDRHVEKVLASQEQLAAQIDRLTKSKKPPEELSADVLQWSTRVSTCCKHRIETRTCACYR
eukprot:1192873-Prorocentrum_minimum.AAC.4